MKNTLIIILIFSALLGGHSLFGQSGGRKREGKVKARKSFTINQPKSKGNADEFARGSSGRRSKWSRLFTKDKPAWTYKKAGSRRNQNKANRYLFKRHREEGHELNDETLKKQNRKREKKRDRGNESFRRKKY